MPANSPITIPGTSFIMVDDVGYAQGYFARQWKYRINNPSVSDEVVCNQILSGIISGGFTSWETECSSGEYADPFFHFQGPGWSGIASRVAPEFFVVEVRLV